jgi:hypothetical protein
MSREWWHGENWLDFYLAAAEVAEKLAIPLGPAQAHLRKLCASGDIRAIMSEILPDRVMPDSAITSSKVEARESETGVLKGKSLEELALELKTLRSLNELLEENLRLNEEVQYGEPELIPPSRWRSEDVDLMPRHLVAVSDNDLSYWLNQQKPPPQASAPQERGKVPRIKSLLAKLYPDGVPAPAYCNRKKLAGQLLKDDPSLSPLDPKTLKSAIDELNADRKRPEGIGNPGASD